MRHMLLAGLFLALFFIPNLSAQGANLAGSKPNIILVMTDDQGYAPVGRHGHPWINTPNMDRLYDTSTRFDRFLVSPTCSPTRAAIMSGRHPMKNGVTHTILERERMALSTVTLPQVLKTAGYTTGIFGKWHLGDEAPYQPHNRGFDETFIHGGGGIGQAFACSCADVPDNKYLNPIIRHNGSLVQTQGYCTNLFFDAALGWIQEAKEKDAPFFAYIATNAPHGPFVAPPSNTKRFADLGFAEKNAGFYGMIENIDENLGRLMDYLAKWELDENTVLIFMSDNGMTGGGSGKPGAVLGHQPDGTEMLGYNANMKGQKGNVDEGGSRVPFFLRWTGKVPAGMDIDHVAAHIDLLPTFAELAGAKLPVDQVEGRSFVGLLEDPNAPWPARYLFTHKTRWATGADPDEVKWKNYAVRSSRYLLSQNKALYDMWLDPSQQHDIFKENPEIVKTMNAAYEKFWEETRPLLVNEDAPMSPTRPFHVLFEKQSGEAGIPDWDEPRLK